jgi:hypothetical protein
LESFGEPLFGASALKGDEAGNLAGRPREVRRAADSFRILAREIHATKGSVFYDIAQDVRQLQRDAERVRERRRFLWMIRAKDGERKTSDRASDVAAVLDEVVDRVVVGALHVHLTPIDDLSEALHGQVITIVRVGEGEQDRVIRLWIDRRNLLSHELQSRELLFGRIGAVADIVNAPRERVHGRKSLALWFVEQADAVGEILRFASRHTLAPLVGRF